MAHATYLGAAFNPDPLLLHPEKSDDGKYSYHHEAIRLVRMADR